MHNIDRYEQEIKTGFEETTIVRRISNSREYNEILDSDLPFVKIGLRTPVKREAFQKQSNTIFIFTRIGEMIARRENWFFIKGLIENLQVVEASNSLLKDEIENFRNQLISNGINPDYLIISTRHSREIDNLVSNGRYSLWFLASNITRISIDITNLPQNKSILLNGKKVGTLIEKEPITVRFTVFRPEEYDPNRHFGYDPGIDYVLEAYEIVCFNIENKRAGLILNHSSS